MLKQNFYSKFNFFLGSLSRPMYSIIWSIGKRWFIRWRRWRSWQSNKLTLLLESLLFQRFVILHTKIIKTFHINIHYDLLFHFLIFFNTSLICLQRVDVAMASLVVMVKCILQAYHLSIDSRRYILKCNKVD